MLNGERFVPLVCTKIKNADFAYESRIPENILEAKEVGRRSKFASNRGSKFASNRGFFLHIRNLHEITS